MGLLGGVVPLCSLCPLHVVFCVVRASFSINSFSHLSFFAVSCSSSLVTRFAGDDLHNHGAGLSAGRGNDVNVSGIVDVERFANDLLVYCDCNLDIVVAWHKLAHQNPAFLVAVGRRPSCWSIRDQPRRATRPLRHRTWPSPCIWWQV